MSEATVSVIIPTYNRASFLPETIACALAQTHPPLEVLVCDDGSTDNSEAVVAAIGDAPVRWLPGPPSGGPAAPRNRGVREARGDWVGFCDSDDRWLPDKLQKQLVAAIAHGARACCTNASTGPENSRQYFETHQSSLVSFREMLRTNRVIASSALVHRNMPLFFPETNDLRALEDYACWLRVATATDWLYLDEATLAYAVDSPDNIRQNAVLQEQEQRRRVFADFIGWARIHAPRQSCIVESVSKRERLKRDLRRLGRDAKNVWLKK